MTTVDPDRCPGCWVEVVEGARWCGSCGERLPWREAPDGPEVPAEGDAGEHVAPEAPAGIPAVPGSRRRRWPAVLVGLALLLVALVVLRPEPTPLHEAAPIGWGDAGGRDAARTGRIDADPLGAPNGVVWDQGLGVESGYSLGEVLGDVVVVSRDGRFDVVDAADGEVLWAGTGFDVRLVDGGLLSWLPGGATLRERRTGEVRWEREQDERTELQVVEGALFEVTRTVSGDASDPRGSGSWLRRLEVADGSVLWEQHLPRRQLRVVSIAGSRALLTSAVSEVQDVDVAGLTTVVVTEEHATVDLATGQDLVEVDWPSGADQQVVALGDGRGVLRVGEQAHLFDLTTGMVLERAPQLDGNVLLAEGPALLVRRRDGATMFDRGTLEVLWEGEHEVLYPIASPLSTGVLVVRSAPSGSPEPVLGAIEFPSGRELYQLPPEEFGQLVTPLHDGLLVRRDGGSVELRDTDDAMIWTTSPGAARFAAARPVGGAMLATIGGNWTVVAADGSLVSPPLSEVGEAPRTDQAVATGDRIVAGRNGLSSYRIDGAGVRFQWALPVARLDAMVGAPEQLWVAADGRLRRVAANDGAVLADVPMDAVATMSVAGGEALVLLASDGDDGCILPEPAGCGLVAERRDPADLALRWRAGPIDGVCAPATLAGAVVAVPTITGVVFLSATDGREVGRWFVDDTVCQQLGFDGDLFVLSSLSGLRVGRAVEAPTLVATEGAVETAPTLLGSQALVGLATGAVVAVDLDARGVQWSVPIGARMSSVTAHDGSVFVVLAHGRLLRLD